MLIIAVVAFLWLLAECTHRSGEKRVSEPLHDVNAPVTATTMSEVVAQNVVYAGFAPRLNGGGQSRGV
jgi:hypothetical protein